MKMTIDEVIQWYTQRAENYEYILHSGEFIGEDGEHMKQDIKRCVSEDRQLVEWLTELKELRSLKTDYVFFKAEAKKFLKAAVEDMNDNEICYDIDTNTYKVCTQVDKFSCDTFKWRYTAEALKLIGDE